LLIADDGCGISEERAEPQGMGMHIMSYRSSMVGGTLEVSCKATQGTSVSCKFPMKGS
jgi:nitrate/nitrite-specific signal transduction histidine kinase